MSDRDFSRGLEDQAGLISFQVAAWRDLGYETPPTPDCKPIPPLGERSAAAIKAGHAAIDAIDELTRQLYALRGQLLGELRQDSDIRAARVDAMLAGSTLLAGLRDRMGVGEPVDRPGDEFGPVEEPDEVRAACESHGGTAEPAACWQCQGVTR